MNNNVLISIVVPSYNRAHLIGKTLQSLQAQSDPRMEIIIVDDGSTDDTEAVVQPYLNERTTYHKKENAERAAARNYGAARAKGRYVNFFDSDDLAHDNHVATAIAFAEEKNQPEWFHLGYEWSLPDGEIFKRINNLTGATLNDALIKGNFLSCNGVFVRRDIIQQHRFNEDRRLSASEDFELWLRLAARYPLYYTNTVTSVVIDHEMRSVRTTHGQKLIERLNLLIHYLEQDTEVQKTFSKQFTNTRTDAMSYIALHLALNPADKLKSIQYVAKTLWMTPTYVTQRRFYATIKNIITQW